MKFKDIKVGDVVYIQAGVRTGFAYREQMFWVPRKVHRLTPTQFILEGDRRYKKDSGKLVGGDYFNIARNLGEDFGGGVVANQVKEKNDLINRLSKLDFIRRVVEKIKVSHDHHNLSEITEKMIEIDLLLGQNEERK